ncbi:hypothetical protein [Nodosilinea sp. FACHB-13]|uniref:hypothetical protein n=1 Tax=Cyanophyceae TaxID=3028117 RepID=UPI0018EF9170|nr:hypothetical protein [Nodosilinea sp. FACHB-13]
MGQSNSTVLRAGRFIALMLAALSLSLSMAHLLELPQRMQFDQQLWVEVTIVENVYRLFGSVGAGFEMGAILAAIALAFWVRRRGAVFYWTLGGAVLLGLAFVGWLLFVLPMNTEFSTWLTKPVPADWTRYRNQWEYAHAAIALIKTLSLSCLLVSVLLDAPGKLAVNSGFERPQHNSLPATTLPSVPARARSTWLWPVRLVVVIIVSAVFFGLITYVFHSVLVGTILSIAGILGLGSSINR